MAAIFYGVQVDIYASLFRANTNGKTSAMRMFASLGLASAVTGILAAYISISLGILPYTPSLFAVVYVPIIIWGILSGALGGVLSARIWEKNLKARFKPVAAVQS